jgi:hypothetical protein
MFTDAQGDVVAYMHAHIRSQQKVDLDLKSWCMGFMELLSCCLFLGSGCIVRLACCVFWYFVALM